MADPLEQIRLASEAAQENYKATLKLILAQILTIRGGLMKLGFTSAEFEAMLRHMAPQADDLIERNVKPQRPPLDIDRALESIARQVTPPRE